PSPQSPVPSPQSLTRVGILHCREGKTRWTREENRTKSDALGNQKSPSKYCCAYQIFLIHPFDYAQDKPSLSSWSCLHS
ncbi:hypothetical protein, partial [Sphaerospermopsis sp. FACHB-1094]|uniref:hypothetical protein n=1 Tax=Sphaerospermopsis sp. FACHB-1094 TaxID=2692861 RepID=UPI001A7E73B7